MPSVQLAPGAMLVPDMQVLLAMLNSGLLTAVEPSIRATVPVLVNVMVCAVAEAPTVVGAKESTALDSDAAGTPTMTLAPVPDSDTVLVAGAAL